MMYLSWEHDYCSDVAFNYDLQSVIGQLFAGAHCCYSCNSVLI